MGEEEFKPSTKTIDWEDAKKQAGGDLDFLTEVLHDLLEEAQTAKSDIETGMGTKDFDKVMKAAHRLKGSAAYLGCEAMRDSMMKMQHDAKGGISLENEAEKDLLWKDLGGQYQGFLVALHNLKEEVSQWFANAKKSPNQESN